MKNITAVILNYNMDVTNLIKELRNQSVIDEIIVLENNSETFTHYGNGVCVHECPEVQQIFLGKEHSFAAANNKGIDIAKNEYVLLCNNDIWGISGDLQTSIDMMETSDRIKVVGHKILSPDGLLNHAGADFKSELGPHDPYHIGLGENPNIPKYNKVREVRTEQF